MGTGRRHAFLARKGRRRLPLRRGRGGTGRVLEGQAEGIVPRKYFYPLTNDFDCYKEYPSAGKEKTPIAAHIADRVLTLPMYGDLAPEIVDRICDIILR